MNPGFFLLSGIAMAMLAGCASTSQSDEPLWRDPPASRNAAVVTPGPRLAAPSEQKSPVVLAVIDDQPAKPIPMSLFIVNSDERSVMPLLRRWARASKVDFTWSSSVDYVLTDRMRSIEASTLESAVEEIHKALDGVSTPLSIAFDGKAITVTPVQSADPLPAAIPTPVAIAPAPASAPVVPRPVAPVPAPAPVVVQAPAAAPVSAQPVAAAPAPAPAALVARPVAAAPIDGAQGSWDAAARAAAGVLPMTWKVGDSQSLRAVVEAWGKVAGVRVVWEASTDYAVTDEVRAGKYAGTFKEALMQLAASFGQLPAPVGMTFIEQGRGVKVFNIRPT